MKTKITYIWITSLFATTLLNVMLLSSNNLNVTTVIYSKSQYLPSQRHNGIQNKGQRIDDTLTDQKVAKTRMNRVNDITQKRNNFENNTQANEQSFIKNLWDNIANIAVPRKKEVIFKSLVRPQSIKVLCLIMTQPNNTRTKARAVKETWGKRCTKLLFISSVPDRRLPALGFNTPEGLIKLRNETFKTVARVTFRTLANIKDGVFCGNS